MSKLAYYSVALTPGDVDFLREAAEFIEDILDAVEAQDAIAEEEE